MWRWRLFYTAMTAHSNENASLCRIPITQYQPESSLTSQSQAFRGKMGVKGNFSHIVYHKGWQLTLLNVLTKSLSEFFYFALYEKHSSCINMEPNIPIIIGFKAQTE